MSWFKNFTRTTVSTSLFLIHSAIGSASDLQTVPYVDLKKFMGDWHVIANIPNAIEKNCVTSIESYALRNDGKIDNWFVCNKKNGHQTKLTSLATVKNTTTNAEWRIRFNLDTFLGKIPVPFHFGYYVLDLDDKNYTYSVIGHPSRGLVWIMAREQRMDDMLYTEILSRLEIQGYNISKIVRLPQIQ
jgi:apolipoprotein D and lipocalin family protein